MSSRSASRPAFSPAFLLLCALLAILCIAGGASRGDVLGQVVVRGAAWAALTAAVLFAAVRHDVRYLRPVVFLLVAAIMLALVQLVPLPPGIWQALPGRETLLDAARVTGEPQPWRPISMVPGATTNALFSLIVPATVLLLLTGMNEREAARLPVVVLATIGAALVFGLLQLLSTNIGNPFVNDTPGQLSGPFANRNHFALFLSLGCLLAPVWASLGHRSAWRGAVALGLILLFVLVILASGSRAGIVLAAVGLAIGLFMIRRTLRHAMRRYPRWAYPALLAGIVAMVVALVIVSILAQRAVSIDRAFGIEQGQDMRSRGLPTVLMMIRAYFPAGSGLGGFDPVFRLHEPFALLKPTYFNHAHNDLLEIVLDAGVPGLAIMFAGLGWWGWASLRVWRAEPDGHGMQGRLGSASIMLILIASLIDYPARTPVVMAILVISASWLARGAAPATAALPKSAKHL